MRVDVAAADRAHEIREAARSWRRAGFINQDALAAIETTYPDDRVRVSLALRVLFFIFTIVALQAAVGLLFFFSGSLATLGVLALIAAVGGAALAEYQIGVLRRSQGGIEAATSFFALVQGIIGTTWLFDQIRPGRAFADNSALLLWLAILAGAAAWRWGYWIYAALAAVLLYLMLAQLPAARWLWLGSVPLLAPLLETASVSSRLPPSLRRCAAAFLAVVLIAGYSALNTYSADERIIEQLAAFFATGRRGPSDVLRGASYALTALYPLAVLAFGLYARRRLWINLGLLLCVASAITFRFYVAFAPLWVVLTGAGVVLLLGASALRRYLDSGSSKERRGFTAEPLFENLEQRAILESAATVAVLTPEARPRESPGVRGGGGEFGGGGASGSF